MRIPAIALLFIATPALAEPGLEVGIRTGFGLPMGKLDAKSASISDSVTGEVPLWIDVGYRIAPGIVVGVYGQAGVGLIKDCGYSDCGITDWRFGVNGRYHVQPGGKIDPWLGIGAGFERIHVALTENNTKVSGDADGWELANFSAGLDIQAGDRVFLGPFVSFSLDETTSEGASFLGQTVSSTDFDKAIHQWLLVGVRGRFDL
jgi:opacity protein-like surface antigen